MSDDPVEQALAELQDLVRCRCHPAYTGRGLRDPDCECDSAEAVTIVADRIEELEAKHQETFQMYVDANEARIDAEAQAAEIERLRSYLERIEKASEFFTNPEHSELTLRYAHEGTQRLEEKP